VAKKLNVAIIGFGAIGTYVAENLIDDETINLVGFLCREGREEIAAQIVPGMKAVSAISDFSIAPCLIADCGGHAGPAAARTSALSSMWRGVHPAAQTDSEVVFASMCPARLPRPQAPGGRRVPDRPGPRPHWEDSTQWKMARQMTP